MFLTSSLSASMEFAPSETPKKSFDTTRVVDDILTNENCKKSLKNG